MVSGSCSCSPRLDASCCGLRDWFFWNVEVRKSVDHSARGEPAMGGDVVCDLKREAWRTWRSVISTSHQFPPSFDIEVHLPNGNSFRTSCLLSFSGYAGNCSFTRPLSTGGIVMRGFKLVSANTRALATLSAYVLNSAPGVIWLRRFSALRKGVSGCLMRLKGGMGMDVVVGEYMRCKGGGC